ncbi:MAG: hypothetical protein LBI19_03325 [Oscillospiraceae bacterium]|jgi:lysophospholipid acyltransferase (LPLAT)-like uncharacterized protein|nr:hypothetical protein [Oscillospiraceae bacterium]
MGRFSDRFWAGLAAGYMRFVYATSKVTREGHTELLDGGDTFAVGLWHGDSFCYYPQLQNRGDVIVTTINKRGDVVAALGRKFGYNPIRLPDEHNPDVSLLNLRRMLADAGSQHICFSMDGPLGPYHIPSRFFLTAAYLAKKRIMPISVKVKRKIRLTRRWDKYMIPLPFSRITFTFHQPLEVKKDAFAALTEQIITIMDGGPRD